MSDLLSELEAIASDLTCNEHDHGGRAHHCPNCDNTLFKVRERVAALARQYQQAPAQGHSQALGVCAGGTECFVNCDSYPACLVTDANDMNLFVSLSAVNQIVKDEHQYAFGHAARRSCERITENIDHLPKYTASGDDAAIKSAGGGE